MLDIAFSPMNFWIDFITHFSPFKLYFKVFLSLTEKTVTFQLFLNQCLIFII